MKEVKATNLWKIGDKIYGVKGRSDFRIGDVIFDRRKNTFVLIEDKYDLAYMSYVAPEFIIVMDEV